MKNGVKQGKNIVKEHLLRRTLEKLSKKTIFFFYKKKCKKNVFFMFL